MVSAKELVEDAKNWGKPKEFKLFWEEQGIELGTNRINENIREVKFLEKADMYVKFPNEKRNKRVHKYNFMDYIMEKANEKTKKNLS